MTVNPSDIQGLPGEGESVGNAMIELLQDLAEGGAGGGITEITSTDMSVTITDPTGPTADLSVSGGSQLVKYFDFAFDTPGVGVQPSAITALNQGTPSFSVAGDLTDFIEAGDGLTVSGSTLNDGIYTVVSAAFGAGETVITVVEAIVDPTVDGDIGILAGVPFYTPVIGDIILDGWLEITTAWDGTAFGDFGPSLAVTYGVLGFEVGTCNMGQADYGNPNSLNLLLNDQTKTDAVIANANSDGGYRILPGKVLTTRPWRVWVTDSGQRDGGASGAATGTARVFLVMATPTPFA